MNLTPTREQVAATVRRLMEARGVSQVALAEATGIPRVTLIRRLNGQAAFSVEELGAIAVHLDVSLPELLVAA